MGLCHLQKTLALSNVESLWRCVKLVRLPPFDTSSPVTISYMRACMVSGATSQAAEMHGEGKSIQAPMGMRQLQNALDLNKADSL